MRPTLLPFAASLTLLACAPSRASAPDLPKTDASTAEAVEAQEPEAASPAAEQRRQWAAEAAAADALVRDFAEAAKAYYMSEQSITDVDGEHPWHYELDPESVGYPIRWDNYSFPGGTNFTFTTHEALPRSPAPLEPYSSSPFLAATLAQLTRSGLTLPESSRFRVTYATQSETGLGAHLILTAQADFDPSTPEVHTITRHVTIDPDTQEVVISPPEVTDALE